MGTKPAEEHARIAVETGAFDLLAVCPARRPIGSNVARLASAPQRSRDRSTAAHKTACARDRTGAIEDIRRIGIEMVPPRKDRPGMIDRPMAKDEPGAPEFSLPR